MCAAYWWLLFETVGGRRAVDAVVTVDDPHAEHRSPSGKKLQASIELFLSRVCSLTGVDTPAVQVTSFTKGHNPFLHTAEVVVGDQHHSWTSGDRTALRPLLLRAAETPEDPPTKLDALMATQERIDADWAEAIGAQQRTEDLSLDDRIDALAAALDRTDVTDVFARREEGEDEGILGLTVDGIPHEVPCAFEGKYLDLEALDALGDLLAPADREQVAVGDTLAWPLTEQAESFRKLVAGG